MFSLAAYWYLIATLCDAKGQNCQVVPRYVGSYVDRDTCQMAQINFMNSIDRKTTTIQNSQCCSSCPGNTRL